MRNNNKKTFKKNNKNDTPNLIYKSGDWFWLTDTVTDSPLSLSLKEKTRTSRIPLDSTRPDSPSRQLTNRTQMMNKRSRTDLDQAVVNVCKRELGQLSTRDFAHRLAASEVTHRFLPSFSNYSAIIDKLNWSRACLVVVFLLGSCIEAWNTQEVGEARRVREHAEF